IFQVRRTALLRPFVPGPSDGSAVHARSSNSIFVRITSGLAGLVGVGVLVCHAQIGQANLRGVVTDNSGAAIPGAKVTITNAATGESRSVLTAEGGSYVISTLDPA